MTVSPIFGGLSFKANDLNVHQSIFPPGWTIILETEDGDEALDDDDVTKLPKRHHTHRYRAPTLNRDNLFISSISNPSNTDFKPATSPTRQTAMMPWATLWWYFHQVFYQATFANLKLILEVSPNRTRTSALASAPKSQKKPGRRVNGGYRQHFPSQGPLGEEMSLIKDEAQSLDIPVFREPGRVMDGYRTSPTKPLHSSTRLRYLRQLGRNSGLENSFTQYCARRGLVNAVNSKSIVLPGPSSFYCGTDAYTRTSCRQSTVIDARLDFRSSVECGPVLPRPGGPIQHSGCLLGPTFR